MEDTKAEIIENKNKIDKKEKSKKQKKKKENDDESDMETERVEGEELEIKKNSGKKRKAPPKDDIDFDNMTFDADLTFDQENLTIKRVKMGNIIVASGFSTGTDPSTKEEFRYPALQITRRSKAGKTWTTAIPMTMAKRLRDATNIILDANPVFN